ncbi:hypothetical protein F2P79_008761 [Pimephales promelas]|nr:hypothetical protein F2P79_008761 [Pimephales promelas]
MKPAVCVCVCARALALRERPLGISRSSRVKESSARAARTALECSGDSRRAGQELSIVYQRPKKTPE